VWDLPYKLSFSSSAHALVKHRQMRWLPRTPPQWGTVFASDNLR